MRSCMCVLSARAYVCYVLALDTPNVNEESEGSPLLEIRTSWYDLKKAIKKYNPPPEPSIIRVERQVVPLNRGVIINQGMWG